MSMQAGFEALTKEAGEWDTTSEALADAASTVSGLVLTTAQFSGLASTTGLDTSYSAAQRFVEEVLRAGSQETKQLADALRQVRSDFKSTDGAVVAEVSALWVPE